MFQRVLRKLETHKVTRRSRIGERICEDCDKTHRHEGEVDAGQLGRSFGERLPPVHRTYEITAAKGLRVTPFLLHVRRVFRGRGPAELKDVRDIDMAKDGRAPLLAAAQHFRVAEIRVPEGFVGVLQPLDDVAVAM